MSQMVFLRFLHTDTQLVVRMLTAVYSSTGDVRIELVFLAICWSKTKIR